MLLRSLARRCRVPGYHGFLTTKTTKTTKTTTKMRARSIHHAPAGLSVAVVGAGPSGFYTAKYLRSAVTKTDGRRLVVDILDRLPTPYGLVRSGVAPDHPEVKNVEHDLRATVVDHDDTAFFGNVAVGDRNVVTLRELLGLYDAVVLAYGSGSDRKLPLAGASLRGVLPAREFVNWYNGHPDYASLGTELSSLLSSSNDDAVLSNRVVVVGQGNVALDCARILAKGGSGLYDTDLAAHALDVLQDGVQSTTVLGRRGHVQGAFTIKELREMTKLWKEGHNTSFLVRADELDLGTTEATLEELKTTRPKVRIDKLLRDTAASGSDSGPETKELSLRFLLNPVKFLPKEDDPSRLGSIICERTKLQGEAHNQVAVGTGEHEVIDADMALVSIGYRGMPIPGLGEDAFDDERGVVRNVHGKVTGNGLPDHGLYVCGWLKRGPSGIIGTNINDAKDTVATMMTDMDRLCGRSAGEPQCTELGNDTGGAVGREGLLRMLQARGVDVVDWASYEKIDSVETSSERRRSESQPREKITNIEEMLSIVRR